MPSPSNKSQLGRKGKCEDGRIMVNEGKKTNPNETTNPDKTKRYQKCVTKFEEVEKNLHIRVRTGLTVSAL